VRLRRLEGVQSVNVSLNEGRAAIELKAGNVVTLEQVHTIVRHGGFTPRAARVTARADVVADTDPPRVRITGTGESFAATSTDPGVRDVHTALIDWDANGISTTVLVSKSTPAWA
jgi:hypothetical protein